MAKAVVLIHGLMTNSLIMTYLGFKIASQGYKIYYFNYKSRKYSDQTLQDLDSFITKIKEEEIYLIGHSMGGLIIRNYLHKEEYKENFFKIKSVVTIATPHNQSLTAHKIKKSLNGFFGTASDAGLTKDVKKWTSKIPLACIAGLYNGKWNTNLFLMLNNIKEPSDGTVFVKEAILNGCHESIIMEGSHTGIIFKKSVAKQIINFLNNGNFNK